MHRTEVDDCDECDFITTDGIDALQRHKQQEHTRKITCNRCPFSTDEGQQRMNEHVQTVHERRSTLRDALPSVVVNKCAHCPSTFDSREELASHLKKAIRCEDCSRFVTCEGEERFKNHVRFQHSRQCKFCKAIVIDKQYQLHVASCEERKKFKTVSRLVCLLSDYWYQIIVRLI